MNWYAGLNTMRLATRQTWTSYFLLPVITEKNQQRGFHFWYVKKAVKSQINHGENKKER